MSMLVTRMTLLRMMTVFVFVAPICGEVAAAGSVCQIDIKDVWSSLTFRIDHKFEEDTDGVAQQRLFRLPGDGRSCTLVWFSPDTGTSLMCELDELGETYIRSDRTEVNEKEPKNFLLFSVGDAFFDISVVCGDA